MNKINKQLIRIASDLKKQQALQEIDQYTKQIRDIWNQKNSVADFIVSAFLQQKITESILGKSLSSFMAASSFEYEGIDELSQKTYKSYSQIYTKITHSVSKQTVQKMKKVDRNKLIQWVSKNFSSNKSLASMRRALFNEATKLGKQIMELKRNVEKQGVSVQVQNQDQFNFQINQI